MKKFFISLISILLFVPPSTYAQDCPPIELKQRNELFKKHLGPYSLPGYVVVHRGHAYSFDEQHLVPAWVAWRAEKSYRDVPAREGIWERFRPDPYLPKNLQVVTGDYTGMSYHRGHIAPYFISGGDRDGDGKDAEFETRKGYPIEDIDDACTVFEINYMSNIAPQRADLNSQSGTWYDLEEEIRDRLKEVDVVLQIVAGPIFLSQNSRTIGRGAQKISVPDAFFQVLDDGKTRTAYLFFQEKRIGTTQGCLPRDELATCIVPLNLVSELAGLPLAN